jgi:hypothetical protein
MRATLEKVIADPKMTVKQVMIVALWPNRRRLRPQIVGPAEKLVAKYYPACRWCR